MSSLRFGRRSARTQNSFLSGPTSTPPALIARLADAGVPGTQVEQATDLFVLPPVGWVDVEMEPVLDGLAPGTLANVKTWWHRAKAVPGTEHQDRARPPGSAQSITSSARITRAGRCAGIPGRREFCRAGQ